MGAEDLRKQTWKDKNAGVLVDAAVYLTAFGVGLIPFILIENLFLAAAMLTAAATVVIFLFSTLFSDVSVYDPYWSVAPPVLLLACMCKYNLWTANAWILLGLIGVWSLRLTGNWYYTYKGLGHEDWRYAQYRKNCSAPLFHLISFVGLHFVPTIVVYLGMTGALFSARETVFAPLSLAGGAVMLGAVALEYVSDRSIHRFLAEHKGEKRTCDVSVWKYSRHPNYLGEMTFWTGLYLYFAACCPADWYKGLGFLSILLLFLTVSIPMMEKHNLERRADYADYREKTSMLLLLPNRKG